MPRRNVPFAWQVMGLQVSLLVLVFGLACVPLLVAGGWLALRYGG